MTLAEVAADVAAALGLPPFYDRSGEKAGYGSPFSSKSIDADGENLTDPYWRCACLDWLTDQRGLAVTIGVYGTWASVEASNFPEIFLDHPEDEALPRLVSAVWRRHNDAIDRQSAEEKS